MKRTILLSILVLAVTAAAGCKKASPPQPLPPSEELQLREQQQAAIQVFAPDAAAVILKTYSDNYRLLRPVKLGHWTLRLFRISGDVRHRPAAGTYARLLQEKFRIHIANLSTPGYSVSTAEKFLALPPDAIPKKIARSAALAEWKEMVFAKRLLYLAFQIKSFGLHQGPAASDFLKAVDYFRTLPFEAYVTDPQVIRYDAAHTANVIFYLKFLGLGDYEAPFTRQFKKVFFSVPDDGLDEVEFRNKIYGLTHFIIGASYFYQRPVRDEKYDWILDYFEDEIETIRARSTPDQMAEVALCFKLAGRPDSAAVPAAQEAILQLFSPEYGVLLSKKYLSLLPEKNTGDIAVLTPLLNDLEHRNIMAYMAMTEIDTVYPGPDLLERPAR